MRHVKALAITVRALTARMPSGVRGAPEARYAGLGGGDGDGRDDQGGDPVAAAGNCWA